MSRALSLACCLVAASCGDRTDPVVVYVSADEYVARQVLDEFEIETGIPVLVVGDTEARKTTGLVQRLRAEARRPVADVFWSSEAVQTAALAHDGLLAPHVSATTTHWPRAWRDDIHRWHGFSPRPRVLVHDPARLATAEVPATWSGLADERWRGEVVFADPRYGTTGGHLAAMSSSMPEAWGDWVDALAANDVRVLPGGNSAVVDAVLRGEAMLGATDADDVRAANRAGAQLAMVIPRHAQADGMGAMLMPNTVAIVQGAPNPHAAARLVDWLLSDRVADILASSTSGNVPLQPAVASRYPELVVDDPLVVDYADLAHSAPDSIDRVVEAWASE